MRVPRIALFTDTLADVNGVSRFVRAAAGHCGELHVIASTRIEGPRAANIHNIAPMFRRPMPGYATIDLAVPSRGAIAAVADGVRPEIVHVSTPGPVGLIGRWYARRRGLPMVATYHTDFPTYVDHLLDDEMLTRMVRAYMRWFYRPFDRVLARTAAFVGAIEAVGIESTRVAHFGAGIDTEMFHPRHRDESGRLWAAIPGARAGSLKLLYVGRISKEKNLHLLGRAWPRVRAECARRGVDVQLVIVGDGPSRPALERGLGVHDAVFAGFRAGVELSALYASSDVFIFPSTTDTLGQAVMEAQASGLPAIVSNRGGPSGIVLHERTGIVLPVSNADRKWIDAAAELLTLPSLRAQLGTAARERVGPMTIAVSLDEFFALHADVAGTKNKPGHALARGPARR